MQIPIFRGGGCVKLIDVCNPKQWKTISASELVEDGYPVFGANGIIGYFSDYNHENPTLCITCRGATCGTVNKSLPYSYITGNSMALDDLDESVITIDFLYYFLQYRGFDDVITGSAQPQITRQSLSKITVPEIDLNIQKNITNIIKRLEQLILIREKQREKFNMLVKSRFNEMFGDPINNDKKFAEKTGQQCFKFSSGKFLDKNDRVFEGYPAYGGNGIAWKSRNYLIDNPTIIIGRVGAYCGNVRTTHGKVWISDNAIYIKEFKNLDFNLVFLLELMKVIDFSRFADFSGQPKITQKPLEKQKYILPPLSLQNEFADFVAQVDKSQFACQKAIKLWRNSLKSSII